ncbi:MAG: cell division protein FtsZ [Patescibacteria group bacterium]|nr:cell division protein FtsZ [Patescibacteria group bacterium]
MKIIKKTKKIPKLVKNSKKRLIPKIKKQPIEEKTRQAKIKIVGIGGGGCSIVSELATNLKKYEFITANTDFQALKKNSRYCKRFQFGQDLTKGLGCGMNPELGKKGAEQEKEKIKKLLQGADFCVLISCLGGGAGSGASPIFAEICKELDIVCLGLFFLPFKFEGEKKAKIASVSLEKIKPNLNALIVISNDKIFQIIDKDISLEKSLSAINKILEKALSGLFEMIYAPGLINIDWADLKTILQGRGKLCYLSCVEEKKDKGIKEIVRMALTNPLSEYGIVGAEKILYNIASDKDLTMEEVEQISVSITDFNSKAKIIFGVTQNPKYKGKIRVALFASGCGRTDVSSTKKEKKKIAFAQKKSALVSENSSEGIKSGIVSALVPAKPRETLAPTNQTVSASAKPKANLVQKRKIVSDSAKKRIADTPKKSSQISEETKSRIASVPASTNKRKNALDIRKEVEQVEKEILEQETKWDTPTFLRNKK